LEEKNRKYFGLSQFKQTKTIWTIGKSHKLLRQNQQKHWKTRISDETLEDICVLFFLQLFLISRQQNLSVVAPLKQTNSYFTF